MRNVVIALTSILFSLTAKADEVEKFSLAPLMNNFGYRGMEWSGRPLDGHGEIHKMIRHEWPFTAFAANGPLSLAAVALDPRYFDKGTRARSVAIFEIPNQRNRPVRHVATARVTQGAHVGSMNFVAESLLRIRELTSAQSDPSVLSYTSDYLFYDADSGYNFSLLGSKAIPGLKSVRAFSDQLYIGLQSQNQQQRFLVFTFNPIDKTIKILKYLDLDLGASLFHDPVDIPGRDVWHLGPNHVEVLFYRDEKYWRLVYKDNQVELLPQAPSSPHIRQIENTTEFLVNRAGVFTILRKNGSQLEPVIGASVSASPSPFSFVRKVTQGFTVEERDHPRYAHWIFRMDGSGELLIFNRLVQSDHKDGGLVGLSEQDKNSGEIFIVRSIYDPESLQQVETGRSDLAAELCEKWLSRKR